MVNCIIGIMAYNEEANIGKLLDSLLQQKTRLVNIDQIIVVASGCTDKTEKIVLEKRKEDQRIILLVEAKRNGKASAINRFIRKINKNIPVLVMISADTLPQVDTIEKLVTPFKDSSVGITSAHVIPLNNTRTFMGFYVHCFWTLHHEIAKKYFKAGELIAWRNIINSINHATSTDETNIAALIFQKGYKGVYVSRAKVFNRGPETVRDFIKVRRRHLAAYYHLKEEVGLSYIPPTMNSIMVLKLFLKTVKPKHFKDILWMWGVILLEIIGKLLAWYDWRVKHEQHSIWEVAVSTKNLSLYKT